MKRLYILAGANGSGKSTVSKVLLPTSGEENRRNGLPNVYVINGKIIWQLPDGSITDVDPLSNAK